MSRELSSKIRVLWESYDEDFGLVLMHWCPGCRARHPINVEKKNYSNAVWSWNSNAEKPTFTPSINIVGRCHYFIQEGKIIFCSDSKHELAGQTVELPDFPGHVSLDD